jgi:diketogulonate reductase-like aldo/keto reductase
MQRFLIASTLFSVVLAADSPTVTLNNGLKMPIVSFGLQVVDDDTATTQVEQYLSVGGRNIFTSVLAGNQAGVGKGIKASTSVARKDLFICGSVNSGSCSSADDCYTSTKSACADNLNALGLDYVDMIMLDYPSSGCDNIVGQWRAFEEMLASKKTLSIAVSNFSPDQLDCIVSNKTATVPSLNQMPYSVGSGASSVVADNAKRGGIIIQAYSPLGSGGLANDPDCTKIGKQYNKSSAQVALKWIAQTNATFSTNCGDSKDYMQEDLDIFDFHLSDADMKVLDAK